MLTKIYVSELDWNNLFDQFNTTFHTRVQNSNFPKVNAWLEKAKTDTDKSKLYIEATLSGYDPNEIEFSIDATECTLTLEYNKPIVDTSIESKKYILQEIKKSSFYRKFTLPPALNLKSVDHQYLNGVLTIMIDLKTDEELGRRKIKIGEK